MSAWSVLAGPSVGDTSNLIDYTSSSFTPTAGKQLVVVVHYLNDGATLALTASANGLTFGAGPVVQAAKNSTTECVAVFLADQVTPGSPSAMTVTLDSTDAVAATGIMWGFVELDALHNVVQVGTQDNAGTGITPSVTLGAAISATNPVLAACGFGTAGLTAPPSFIELVDNTIGSPTRGLEVATADSGVSVATVTWGSTSASAKGSVVVELTPAGGGGGPVNGGSGGPVVGYATSGTGAKTASSTGGPVVGQALAGTGSKRAAAAATTGVAYALSGTGRKVAAAPGGAVVSHALTGSARKVVASSGTVTIGYALAGSAAAGPVNGGSGGPVVAYGLSGSGRKVAAAVATVKLTEALSGTGRKVVAGAGAVAEVLTLAGSGRKRLVAVGTLRLTWTLAGVAGEVAEPPSGIGRTGGGTGPGSTIGVARSGSTVGSLGGRTATLGTTGPGRTGGAL